jgi:hypothetical protein
MGKGRLIKESDIQRNVKQYLQIHGWFVFKNHQSLGSYKGIADLFAIKAGISIWIEIKKPKGVLSPFQIAFEKEITKHGGNYMVARDINELIVGMEKISKDLVEPRLEL